MRILLVEDDVKIASFIIKGLKAAGYAVDHAHDGEKEYLPNSFSLTIEGKDLRSITG